ncbi:hypothetical protein CONPUDRAFT_149283 [Coniophora puteana RWD-64-598 SS2]|uniref:MYND-type domain-containing protein n=1 Tax=Coniophora puteana (strain RWD-64-598) TaxID=741705 RepID=A0A5M3N8R7_CONPW|nr:uncharacterized protein CONPUDRAFT_149283 [Coniophora puteana RWD-64-598 SS2]EIW87251.1 hypothetical protein CONPUDRAFT_149283 [Coniophora puteana RWD-64-598 SS2]
MSSAKDDPQNAYRMDNSGSVFANSFFPVTNVRKSRNKWVRDWDKGVAEICSLERDEEKDWSEGSISVFGFLSVKLNISRRKKLDRRDHLTIRHARDDCAKRYEDVINILRTVKDTSVSRGDQREWFSLISNTSRRDIICEGFEETCWKSFFGQDGRMLCPELTTAELTRDRGQGLFDFFDRCLLAGNAGGVENFENVIVRSDWWRSAEGDDKMRALNTTLEISKWCYEYCTCVRYMFLLDFILLTLRPIVDKCQGVTQALTEESMVANRVLWNLGPAAAQDLLSEQKNVNSRFALGCEHCGHKRTDRGAKKYRVCKKCKQTLNFNVPYCSMRCQKAHWPEHKPRCGREKVSKSRDAGRPEYSYSVALQLQMMMHENHPVDYVLFSRDTIPTGYMAAFQDQTKSDMFGDLLDVLVVDADKPGLDVIAKCLVDAVDDDVTLQSGITREDVIMQLTEEFEIDVRSQLEALEAKLAVENDEERYKGMLIQELVEYDDEDYSSDESEESLD